MSPWIEGAGEDIVWRRELWEYFAPRVRRETDAESAAQTVARQLRLRVVLLSMNSAGNIRQSWQAGQANPEEMRLLQVAAFRSVGLAARLGRHGAIEVAVNGEWRELPKAELTWNFRCEAHVSSTR